MENWIIACNTKYYDIIGAFGKFDKIVWKQSTNIEKGELVYIYVGRPYSQIRYKCIANKVNLKQEDIEDIEFEIDDNEYENYGRYMELQLVESYDNEKLGLNYLKDNGLKSVQGPSRVSDELKKYIDKIIQKKKGMDKEYVLNASNENRRINEKKLKIPVENKGLQLKIEEFCKVVHQGEDEIEELRKQFVSDYSVRKLMELNKEEYVYGTGSHKTFCYRVAVELNELGSIKNGTSTKFGFYFGGFGKDQKLKYRTVSSFGKDETTEELNKAFIEIKKALIELLVAGKNENYDEIKCNKLSTIFKGKLLCIYYPGKYLNVYSIEHVHFFMDKLGILYDSNDSIMNLLQIMIQWKNDNQIIKNWSNHEFSKFLYRVIGVPSKVEKNKKQISKHERKVDQELLEEIEVVKKDDLPRVDDYIPSPVKRPEPILLEGNIAYPRNHRTALKALFRAQYKCEINGEHPSFVRKSNGTQYTEPHHLIPMAEQDKFDKSLDVEANIVSLCSNCHNQLHYGEGAELLIKKLYDKRKDELKLAGIDVTEEKLIEMYK